MPFTLAHPAAVVPLHRVFGRHVVLSALVIGSMMPDAVYFLPLRVSQPESHSIAGAFWFCLPLGLVGYGVFHLLLKVPVAALLPVVVQERLPRLQATLPHVSPVAVVVSLVVGALTHVAWDAFTHAETLPVTLLPGLRTHLFSVSGFDVAVWKLLQHASTVAGLALLAWWSWSTLRVRPVIAQPAVPVVAPGVKAAVLLLLVLTAATAALAGLLNAPPSEWTLAAFRLPVRRAVIAGLQALGAATLALALCLRAAAARPVTTRR